MLKSTIFALWKQIDRKNRWGNPKDLVDILQGEVRKRVSNLIISVSKVVVTSDLSVATVHLYIPSGKSKRP
jgi:ribosome-binding factor A